jgi:hypothetical protein
MNTKSKNTKSNWQYFEFDVQSRYGDIRTIKPTDIERGVYKVMGKACFTRGSGDMYDFEGGPFFMIGEQFYHLGIVAAIQPIDSGHDGYSAVLISVDYNENAYKEMKKWQK